MFNILKDLAIAVENDDYSGMTDKEINLVINSELLNRPNIQFEFEEDAEWSFCNVTSVWGSCIKAGTLDEFILGYTVPLDE